VSDPRCRVHFFTARRYASAALCPSVSVCLSVCLSVTSRCSIETTERIELVFGTELPSAFATLGYKEIRISRKTTILPSGTLSQTPDSKENFASAYRSSKRVVDLARESWTLRA